MSGLPSWAVKGAKVVCINASPLPQAPSWGSSDAPHEGSVYTVTGSAETAHGPVIYLAEISRSEHAKRHWGADAGYGVYRFRPLITQEDDLKAHFEALLHVRNPQLEAAE